MKTEGKLHAEFSASGSDRWLNCPGSIALSKNAPPQVESKYALEGTEAHSVLEVVMKNDCSLATINFLRKKYPASMVDHAIAFYEQVVSLMPVGALLLCETKVELEFVKPDMFGTVDCAIIDLFGTLWVIDYKYGAGRVVDPEENTQMIYYGLGLAHKYHFNFAKVRLAIAQPRIVHRDGFFRTWDMEVEALMEWEAKFKRGVEIAEDPLAPLKPGRWCFFCPASSICPAVEDQALAQAQIDFDDDLIEASPIYYNGSKNQTLSKGVNKNG